MLQKRKWFYVQPPKAYEMAPCSCGNENTQWSEYEKHLWCEKCQKDFIPGHGGVFDGPISVNISMLVGLTFTRFNLETNQVEAVDETESKDGIILYVVCHDQQKFFNEKSIPINVKHFNFRTPNKEEKISIKKGKLSFSNGEIKVELDETFTNCENNYFVATFKIGFPQTKTFSLTMKINDDLKSFQISANEEYKKLKDFVLFNELNNDMSVNNPTKKTVKI